MLEIRITENSSTRVKKALFGDNSGNIKTFAIITPENPMGVQLSVEENNKLTVQFKEDLRRRGISYTKISGSYGNKEKSYLLYNVTIKEVTDFAKKYKQESFFFGRNEMPSEIEYWQTFDDGDTYKLIETKKGVTTLKDAEDYFSRRGDFQFRIDMKVFEDIKNFNESVVDESELLKSLEEDRTPFSRMIHRKASLGIIHK